MTTYDYIKDGDAIYAKSFAIIRAEADLSAFSAAEAELAIRSALGAGRRRLESTRLDFLPNETSNCHHDYLPHLTPPLIGNVSSPSLNKTLQLSAGRE